MIFGRTTGEPVPDFEVVGEVLKYTNNNGSSNKCSNNIGGTRALGFPECPSGRPHKIGRKNETKTTPVAFLEAREHTNLMIPGCYTGLP